MSDSDLVVIYVAQGEGAALVVKSHLESEGIPAVLQYESLGNVLGVLVDGLGQVKVVVPRRFAEEACRVISRGESKAGQ